MPAVKTMRQIASSLLLDQLPMTPVTYHFSKIKAIGMILLSAGLLGMFLCFAMFTDAGFNFGFGWVLFVCALITGAFALIELCDSSPQIVLDDDGFSFDGVVRTWDEVSDMKLKIGMGAAVYSTLTVYFLDGSASAIDVRPLNARDKKIFEEFQKFWYDNRDREDLKYKTQQRLIAERREQEQSISPQVDTASVKETYLFGADLIRSGVDYFPDWSAAMLREYEVLTSSQLENHFEVAQQMNEHDPSQWDDILTSWQNESGHESW